MNTCLFIKNRSSYVFSLFIEVNTGVLSIYIDLKTCILSIIEISTYGCDL